MFKGILTFFQPDPEKSLAILLGVVILSLGIVFVALAWTEPTSPPPGGNVSAPINVSDAAQVKNGQLGVDSLCLTNNTNGSNCRADWPSGGGGYWTEDGGDIYNTNSSGEVKIKNELSIGKPVWTSPYYPLDVEGDSFWMARFRGTSNVGDEKLYLGAGEGSDWSGVGLYTTGEHLMLYNPIQVGLSGDPARIEAGEGEIPLRLNAGGSDRIIIQTNGDVGIGDSSPDAKLDVNGNAEADDFCTHAGTCLSTVSGGTSGDNDWTISSSNMYANTGVSNVGIGMTNPNNPLTVSSPDGDGIEILNEGSGDKSWRIKPYGDNLQIAETGVQNAMTFEAGGDVGIGTNNPSDKLQVDGNISNVGNATMPHLVLDSTNSGDDWNSQGAYISIGESGGLGSASTHLTYRGDGWGFVGSGAPSNAVPAGGFWGFYYNSGRTFTTNDVGIGTDDPSSLLSLGSSLGKKLSVYDNGSLSLAYGLGIDSGQMYAYTSSVDKAMIWHQGGNVEVPSGQVEAKAFIYSSDVSLKNNIDPLDNSLDKVQQLEGISFDWKENGESSIGLTAQNVEEVFPEAVSTGENGLKGVNYGVLTAPLIESVKEQQGQIEKLKEENENQQQQINRLQEEIEQIKEQIEDEEGSN